MPRDGSGVASKPAGTTASPNTTIESAKFNSVIDDIYALLNAALPITTGGTGETTARLKDGTWRFQNSADTTKLLAFDLSGITTATTRTLIAPDANGTLALTSDVIGYATTATAAGTTTLTVASAKNQYFTGTTTQTVVLPVTSTLVLGQQFRIVNNSTGLVTVQSSGANTIQVMGGSGTELVLTCIAITGTGTASWSAQYEAPTTPFVAFTPTLSGFGTPSGVSFFSRRVGDTLEIMGKFVSGVPTATEAQITIGAGLTVDATKVPSIRHCGYIIRSTGSDVQYHPLVTASQGYLTIGIYSTISDGLVSKNGNELVASGNTMSINASIPITGW